MLLQKKKKVLVFPHICSDSVICAYLIAVAHTYVCVCDYEKTHLRPQSVLRFDFWGGEIIDTMKGERYGKKNREQERESPLRCLESVSHFQAGARCSF